MRRELRHPVESLLDPRVRFRVAGKLRHPWWRRRFHAFGEGSVLVSPDWLLGAHHISVGERVTIYPGAWLAAEPATWQGPEPSLVIGDRVVMRHHVVLSASAGIVLEDDVGIAGRVAIVDSDHTWLDGRAFTSANRSTSEAIRIGWGTWVGEQSVILKGTTVGAFCLIAANSVVVGGDFPDYSLIAGTPAKVIGSTRDRVATSLQDQLDERRASQASQS